MCIQIDSRCVIFNMMQARQQVELPQLVAFAVAFKKVFHAAYVDISDASVFSVVEEYVAVISLTGDTIVRGDKFGPFAQRDFLDKTVNRSFTDEVRRHLRACAESTL